jgi:sialate O-acetylesterase
MIFMRLGKMKTFLWATSLCLMLAPAAAVADVKLPPVLGSHMVLQRDMPVPIWGEAMPGEKITVKFRDQEKSTQADGKGKWLVKLDALKAGGPDTLTVNGANTLKLDDVLVGEVWVGSGQSNMAGSVAGYAKGDEVLAKLAAGTYPKLRLMGSNRPGWTEANPQANPGYSALLFAFGVRLQQDLDVPVGLIVGAVGGTPSGYWLSEEMLAADPACQQAIKTFGLTYDFEEQKKKYELALAQWEKAVVQAKKDDKKLPGKPLPPVKPGEMNGKIGNLYERHIKPFLPFAIRGVLWDQGESGTQVLGVDQYTLMGALIRGWRQAWGLGDFVFIFIQKPSGGGCAWDYADPVTKEADKFTKLPETVPPLQAGAYRENHIRIMTYPNTAMAITSDLGPGVHPINKSGYGTRASRVALGMVYSKKVEYYGPLYQGHKVEGDKVRITFTHTGQGLAYKHGDKLQGFAVAGSDKSFVWADAVIDGDTVLVSSPKVTAPVAVRYAWNQTHPWANLFNRDGLPAIPFRTDAMEK